MEIKRCYDTLIGASVGENQLVQSGATSATVPNGHKYYSKINGTETLGASTGTAIAINDSAKDMVTDLTLKFGSAIADYVYGLGASSGIAKLRSWGFLRGYQAYNAGSIESVEVTGKKVVGFNQWDEVWENGFINDNGQNSTLNTAMRSKNYIAVVPGSTYYIHCPRTVFMFHYDANKTFIGKDSTHGSGGNLRNETFVILQNTRYVRFCLYDTPTYNNDICINLSNPDRNGEYEAYTSQTYALGSDKLRGIFKLDANNQLYADGDRKEADGTITRQYGVMDLGTRNWSADGSDGLFISTGFSGAKYIGYLQCSKYLQYRTDTSSTLPDKCIVIGNSQAYPILRIRDTAYAGQTGAAFKEAMSGVMLVYEKQTPTTETGTPFQSPQICYPDGTEEFVTETGVPVGHETRYEL